MHKFRVAYACIVKLNYCVGDLARVADKCLDFIVINRNDIDERCRSVTYDVHIFPLNMTTVFVNSPNSSYNITGLANNTYYAITVRAVKDNNTIHSTALNESTLESLRKNNNVFAKMFHFCIILKTHGSMELKNMKALCCSTQVHYYKTCNFLFFSMEPYALNPS